MTAHISTLKLNQYRYGELESGASDEVRAHIERCEQCASRLAVQERARSEFALQPVPDAIAATAVPANNTRWLFRLAPVVVAALALLLSTFFLLPDDGVRPKGFLPEIEVWVGTDAGPRPLRADEKLSAGDSVQLVYNPAGHPLVTLVGRDGSGTLEVYGSALPEQPDALQPAPFALTLDGARGPQEFWVIASDRPLDDGELLDAIEGRLNDVHVRGVIVPKE